MNKLITSLLTMIGLMAASWAADPAPVTLEKARINIHDTEAIERGAQHFVTYCFACHTLQYLTFDPIAENFNITPEKQPSDALAASMEIPPPDLSLITRSRGEDWVYTYLLSFYKDESQTLGTNNLLAHNTAMPNMLQALQGEQVLKMDMFYLEEYRLYDRKPHWFEILETTSPGSISPEQFDNTITDLVTFLAYAAEPTRSKREKLGWWVLGFLAIFIYITWLLKREYWRDIGAKNALK